jgi:hypothetical protein
MPPGYEFDRSGVKVFPDGKIPSEYRRQASYSLKEQSAGGLGELEAGDFDLQTNPPSFCHMSPQNSQEP